MIDVHMVGEASRTNGRVLRRRREVSVLDENQLGVLLTSVHDGGSVFRFEGLIKYTVSAEAGDYERYVRRLPGPSLTRKQEWLSLLRRETGRGVHWHRVRLLHSPLSDYERYACEWVYPYTTAAGDDCRILDSAEVAVPAVTPPDFWLVDDLIDAQVAIVHYDDEGCFLGATRSNQRAMIDGYREVRRILWERAEPFCPWWDRHPEHHRR